MIRIFATMNGVEGHDGNPGVSGGDVRLIKILKQLGDKAEIVLGVTPMGRRLCDLYDLRCKLHVLKVSDRSGVLGNLARVIRSAITLPRGRFDLAYSGGEHLYDVIPAALLKVFRKTPWLALVHWVEEYPWKDKRGGTPFLHRYLYWLNRVFAMTLIKCLADHILAVSESTRQKLIVDRHIAASRVSTVFCGLDLQFSRDVRSRQSNKAYDAVFMKRLNFGKGVIDLIEIWALVAQANPAAKLQIIGHGPESVVADIRALIAERGIDDNVEIVGVVHDREEKCRRLSESSLFILPSHEENWAIVIGEALTAGLPVIAYDLKEIRPLWGDRVEWIRLGDRQEFAAKILATIERPKVPEIDPFLTSLDWSEIASNEFEHMFRLLHPMESTI